MPNVLNPSLSNTPTYRAETTTPGVTPYAEDLLRRAQSFTTAGTPVYGGQLTTGPSSYQNQAWRGIANLTVPRNITEAGNALGDIAAQQQNLSYTPGSIGNTYSAAGGNYKPINVTSTYNAAVGNYNPSNITNTYNPAAGNYKQYDVQADTFGRDQALQYMNPYIEAALNPQLDLQQRRSAINQQGDMAKLAQAGAFGGSRQAILQGLNQENLLRQQAETAGAGYEKAYTNAQSQFNADQTRKMEAVKLNIDQAKKAADLGMTDAEMTAKYGMTAQQANEASRQFAQTQQMTAADKAAQYGMDAAKLNIQQAQKAADLGMSDAELMARYGMDAAKANEASRQFGATYRQTGLSNAAAAQQARAAAGGQEAQYGLANLNALSSAGAQQHDIEQTALDAQYKDWLRQTDYPSKQLEQMKGITTAMAGVLPKSEVGYGQKQSGLQQVAGGVAGITKLANDLGFKSLDDVAKAYGTSVDALKNIFGISQNPTGSVRNENDLTSPGNQNLYDIENPGWSYGYDYGNDHAKGGLIDMLHKMRGQK